MDLRELKDHEIAMIVNNLKNIGEKYGQHQCLREVMSHYMVDMLKVIKVPTDFQVKQHDK